MKAKERLLMEEAWRVEEIEIEMPSPRDIYWNGYQNGLKRAVQLLMRQGAGGTRGERW